MCEKLIKIKENDCGELHYCESCNTYHLLYKNFHFVLNIKEYQALKNHINDIDIEFWLDKFGETKVKRKIPVATSQENLILVFDIYEFIALKSLFFNQQQVNEIMYLSTDQIEYQTILN